MATTQLPPLLPSLASLCVIYLLYYLYWQLTVGTSRRRMVREHGCQPPFKLPDWDPFFGLGNASTIMRWAEERTLLSNNYKRMTGFGVRTFRTNSFGTVFLLTIEPENLKQILAVQFKNFALPKRRKAAFLPMLGEGIFNTDGAPWQHSRDMLRPNFTRAQVGDLETYERHVCHLLASLPRDGSAVDLQGLFFRLTMDSATELLFGESTKTLLPDEAVPGASEFASAFGRAQEGALNRARFGFLYGVLPDKRYQRDIETVHAFLDRLIDMAFARRERSKAAGAATDGASRYIFADELISRNSDRTWLRGELLNILLAGRDSTASLLSNVWFELSKRPDVFAALKAEIDRLLPGGRAAPPPTYEQLKSAKYLRAVLNESQRLNPIVPGNAREAVVDTVLPLGGGPDGKAPLFVEKGMAVGWSLYTMHRRKDLFGADAEEFRPERWLGPKGLRPGWEYLPFNGGPRVCLGRKCRVGRGALCRTHVLTLCRAICVKRSLVRDDPAVAGIRWAGEPRSEPLGGVAVDNVHRAWRVQGSIEATRMKAKDFRATEVMILD